jgi:hypothetical protein
MSSVPVSMEQLEAITTQVAQELLEDWAINDKFKQEDLLEVSKKAVDDTILVINSFMEHLNYIMMHESENTKSKLIVK